MIRVIRLNEDWKHFLSCEEASLFYGIRRQSIGDILNGRELYHSKYKVENSTVEEVLKHNNVSSTKEYYEKIFTQRRLPNAN